jgi:type I restriction enzyme S subunit
MSTRRVQEWFGVRVLGSAVTGINIGDLRKVPISLPTRPEQRTMVRKLDDDELRTARVAELMMVSISRLRDLKRSLITAAVTGEFDVSTADGSRVSA